MHYEEKNKKFPDIYQIILLKFSRNLKTCIFLKQKLVFVPLNALPRREAREYFWVLGLKCLEKIWFFIFVNRVFFGGHRRTGWFFSRSEVKPSDRRVSGMPCCGVWKSGWGQPPSPLPLVVCCGAPWRPWRSGVWSRWVRLLLDLWLRLRLLRGFDAERE